MSSFWTYLGDRTGGLQNHIRIARTPFGNSQRQRPRTCTRFRAQNGHSYCAPLECRESRGDHLTCGVVDRSAWGQFVVTVSTHHTSFRLNVCRVRFFLSRSTVYRRLAMAENSARFAELLKRAVNRIHANEGMSKTIVRDELGYAAGREGRTAIDHWCRVAEHRPTDQASPEAPASEIPR